MKQERNKLITLGEQIAQTMQNIDEGRDTYPIDIVETIQSYYALPNTVEPESNIYQLETDRMKTLQLIAKKYDCLIITAAQEPKELKVFMVNEKYKHENLNYNECENDIFIQESIRQRLNYTLERFQTDFNNKDLPNLNTVLIRFI
jgi:hypothetical protein